MKVITAKKIGREEALKGFVEFSRRMVVGLHNPQEGAEQVQPWLDELVESGRLSSAQGVEISKQLKQQSEQVWNTLENQIRRIVQDTVTRLKTIADNEITELEGRISRLETNKSGKISISKTI